MARLVLMGLACLIALSGLGREAAARGNTPPAMSALEKRFQAGNRRLARRFAPAARHLRHVGARKTRRPPRRLLRRAAKIRRYGLRQIRRPMAKRRLVRRAPKVPPRRVARALPQEAARLSGPVYRAAKRYGLKPSLIFAMIKNESAFRPRAVSPKGAVGLMQLMPERGGREALSYLKGRRATPSQAALHRPGTNIELGAAYLHLLGTRYFGGVKDPLSRRYAVIAAYNAGPARTARALTGSPDMAQAVRQINRMSPKALYQRLLARLPAAETRAYLARVTRDMGRFGSADRRT